MGVTVLPLSEAGDCAARQFRVQGLREAWGWAQREWTQVTADTGVGNPAATTPEKGMRCLEAITQTIGKFLIELDAADTKDLYE